MKKSWFANMPASVQLGKQGTNTVQFQVLQDGSIPKDSVKLVSSSGKDSASVRAAREAGPFGHLPEKYPHPSISLRFGFSYNIPGKT
jgi:TonB family protein